MQLALLRSTCSWWRPRFSNSCAYQKLRKQ